MTDGQVKPEGNAGDAGGRAFTQEEVNRIVTERLARERTQYADYDANKKRLADLEAEKAQREDLEKSERQKEIDRVKKETEKTLRGEFAEKEKTWQVERAIERELSAAGVSDPDVRRLLAGEFAVTTEAEAKEKVAALLAAKPYLKPAANVKPLGAGGTPAGTGTPSPIDIPESRMEILARQGKWITSDERKWVQSGEAQIIPGK